MRTILLGLLAGAVVMCGCDRTRAATPGSTDTPKADAPAPAATSWREVTIPTGTTLAVTLDSAIGSDISRVEEPVTAHVTRPVRVHGEMVIPEGSRVSGAVIDATRSAKVKGRAHVAVRFDTITPLDDDRRYAIQTTSVGRTATSTKQKDALEIGAPAAGGAIVGALLGGKTGALVGTAVGGGAGTAVVLSTRGKEVRLPKGSALTLTLTEPIVIKIRG